MAAIREPDVTVALAIEHGLSADEYERVTARLGLVLLFTFMTDSLLRLLCMLFACFIILLTHVHVKPYKDWRGDFAGTLSAAGLVILASVNLVRAGFEAAEYTPSGPNTALMWGFTQVENALLLWAPLAILIIILVVLIVRVAVVIYDCIKKCICKADYRSDVIAKSEGSVGERGITGLIVSDLMEAGD